MFLVVISEDKFAQSYLVGRVEFWFPLQDVIIRSRHSLLDSTTTEMLIGWLLP